MRTTVELDPDTAQAVQALRREEGRGVSEAINELIRRGILIEPGRQPFVPRTRSMGIKIDISNISDALDLLEGSDAR